jgi:hypothetical protein
MLRGFQKRRGGKPGQKPSKAALDEFLPEKRPNKHTDRVAWNEHFERELRLKYTRFSFNISLPESSDHWAFKGMDITEHNLSIAQRTKELMHAEGLLAALAVENLTYGSFEAEWKELPVRKKKDLALEALYRGACYCPRDNSRVICPELTITGLIGDGEYNLINLVRSTVRQMLVL